MAATSAEPSLQDDREPKTAPHGTAGPSLARAGVAVFALLMLVSGVLKIAEPGPAALFLLELGDGAVDQLAARALVAGLSLAQATIGLLLLVRGGRAVATAAWVLVIALGAVEVIALLRGVSLDCGCFGAFDVPHWLSVAGLAIGAVGLLLGGARRAGAVRTGRVRQATVGAFVLVLGAWAGVDLAQARATARELGAGGSGAGSAGNGGDSAPANGTGSRTAPANAGAGPAIVRRPFQAIEILRDVDDVTVPTLVVIGGGDCEHCCRFLDAFFALSPLRTAGVKVVFAAHEPLRGGACVARHLGSIDLRVVPPRFWFWLQKGQPPTFYFGTGVAPGEFEVSGDVDAMLQRLDRWFDDGR